MPSVCLQRSACFHPRLPPPANPSILPRAEQRSPSLVLHSRGQQFAANAANAADLKKRLSRPANRVPAACFAVADVQPQPAG